METSISKNQLFILASTFPAVSGIYSIINLETGMRYVGQSKNIRIRLRDHTRELLKNTHVNNHLQSAFNVSPEAFSFEILEEVSVIDLDEREIYWINYYDTRNQSRGYNLAPGGGGHIRDYYLWADSESIIRTKQKISEASKRQVFTPERRAAISASQKGVPKSVPPWNKGKKGEYTLSEETKQKLSSIRKGRPCTWGKVCQDAPLLKRLELSCLVH